MAKGGKSKSKGSRTQLCASGEKGCVKPDGTVVWVFCEACQQWYHCPCANVDSKKATDEDFIFVCKSCKPQKEKEFNAMKPDLKRQIGVIMDRHPVFSTALIARRCFASKTASNEYHFGRPGIPVTLRELEEKMMRDVSSVDHFKHMTKVMVDRMVSSVKGEFVDEAKIIKTEIEKLLLGGNGPVEVNSTSRSKKGSNKENNAEEKSSKVNDAAKTNAKAETPKANKRGNKVENAKSPEKAPPAKAKKGGAVNKNNKKKEEEVKNEELDDNKCDVCRNVILPPMYQCLELHVTCHLCFQKAVRGYCPVCQNESKRNRRTKKHDNWTTVKKRQQNENLPNDAKSTSEEEEEEEAEKKPPATTTNEDKTKSGPVANAKTTGGGRKRKNALAPVNSNRGAKVAKTSSKIITGGSPAKIAIAGNSLVSTSLSQPLPPQVVLPTTPVAASQVQTIKSSAPPPQVIQLRPTGTLAPTGMPASSMQIRPLRPGTMAPGPRPQFFKIVGGKPVQMSNLQRLPGAAVSALQSPGGGRVVYMRAPVPTQQVSTAATTSSAAVVPTTAIASTATASGGNKIILLSNKGQAIPVSKGAVVSGAPSIVRIVSPNNLTTGVGGKLTLAPNSPTKMATLRPAGAGATGPILLRTVAPRPVGGATSPPIQLPMAPLPKSALTSNAPGSSPDKKTVTSNDTAKAIQVLLPKSPLPPTTAVNSNLSPQKSPTLGGGIAMTTTTTTTASGAFVWTNSTRANFKLSSRINFASLDKFKDVVNKDIQFILASIVTEDKSNEFSFRLHLKREAVPEAKPSKGKKGQQQQQQPEQQSYLELEGKAKVPTAQEWSLKVKTEPPVFLVSKGNFLADFPSVRIPKEIAEKPFVDYELHIDKCSPMQVATASSAAAAAASNTAPPPTKRGRKAAAK